uniref:Putative ovule protein n=1 Tax=Solanum chacoense TaxID=4108 RepID=A0A0V0GKX2_SOLCH
MGEKLNLKSKFPFSKASSEEIWKSLKRGKRGREGLTLRLLGYGFCRVVGWDFCSVISGFVLLAASVVT